MSHQDAGNVTKFLQYLATQQDVYAERRNSGYLKAQYKGKDRLIKLGTPGTFDITGYLEHRRLRWAIPFELEAKRPGGKPRATQIARSEMLTRLNVPHLIADSLAEVVQFIEDLRES